MLVRMMNTVIEDVMRRESISNCEVKILKRHLRKLESRGENEDSDKIE